MAKIFIVEDEIYLCEIYKEIFEIQGHYVVGAAHDGEKALSMYMDLKEKPDDVIMDYPLPIKNGIQVSKKIMEFDENVKIIFASAVSSAMAMGTIAFKSKPFGSERLMANIEKAIHKGEKQRD